MVQEMVWVLSSTIGVGIAPYTQVIPEPAKLLLLGTALVGGAFWTRRQMKVYYEACRNKADALHRERYLKTAYGKRFLKNRLKKDLKT